MYYNEKHKQRVENRGDNYKYIGSYKSKEITIDGKNKKGNATYIRVKCPYCGHSLVGYRPFPKECPKCHKKFEFEKLE